MRYRERHKKALNILNELFIAEYLEGVYEVHCSHFGVLRNVDITVRLKDESILIICSDELYILEPSFRYTQRHKTENEHKLREYLEEIVSAYRNR